ncbi:tail fiber protein [Flectobacillus longus]|uniref:tail fiber protein n=1 Tax=Flectobacillus longus TaxID=2984207 RepID=UPI0024B69EBF|nr:tail fiber protein [Flectobacillus longus]MDI9882432.1 tail fiber protein [Flectobacillus longus]
MKEKVLFKSTSGVSTEKVIGTLPTGGAANMLFVKGSTTDYDGIWQALTTAMITGALTAGSLSPSLIVQDSNNRFVTDSQISAWNAKANATDLNNYLPLAGGFMSGALRFSSPYGQNYLSKGTGDGATSTIYNLEIASWFGIGFKDTCYNTINIIFDTRAGKIQTKKVQITDFNNGVVDAPVVAAADGTLAKKAISAAFVTESTDKRFVTDSQISAWNAKISGITLEEDSTAKSTGNTAINFSHGAYAIVSVVGKVVRYNVDVVTDNSRWLDTVTNPVATNLVKSKLDGKADWGHGHSWDSISGKPTEFNPTGHSHHWDSIYGKPGVFNVLLKENGGDRSVNAAIDFSNGTYNVAQVDGNTVRYHVDVVTDNSRWADWCTNPVATNLVKSKLDGKADWGHNHHWDNIDGKPLYINGSVLVSNLRFYSPNGSTLDGMNYIGHINSEVIASNSISVNDLRLNGTPTYAKSSAPSGYLTLDGNRVIFVNSFY